MIYAAAHEADVQSERAQAILASEDSLLTTDHVLVETWRLARDRHGWGAAERLAHALRSGPTELVSVRAEDLAVALAIGTAFADQGFSLVDRTSFAVMERMGIDRAATFDDDFAVYRYGPGRDRAFQLVR
jgi:predicted nucleic acid-binding protein